MEKPFLSIITINYNNLAGLKKTVESVLEQAFGNFEYILIDGASSDGSAEYLASHVDRFTYCISEPDKGIYDAMNKGIEKATGAYLLFLNSGDTLNGEMAINDFINHKDFGGDIIYGDYLFNKGHKKYPDRLYAAYFMKTSLPHQSTFFKAEVFDKLGGYDLQFPMSADRAFYIKAYLSGQFEFRYVAVFLSRFDLSGLSNDPQHQARKLEEDQLMLKACYGDQYQQMKAQIERELKAAKVPKYSPKGIWKRIKKRLRDL
jgi:glycosyltransferase involved in cell wall biosynthesis